MNQLLAMNVPSSTSQDPSTSEALVERAGQLSRRLAAERATIAAMKRTTPELVSEIAAAGFFDVLRPRRYGGPGHDMATAYRIGRVFSYGDASTAWAYMVTRSADIFVGLLPEETQAAYWNSERAVSASSLMPTGKAIATDGGHRVSGKWSYCSGIDMAGWVIVGAFPDTPPAGGGRPDMLCFLVPVAQVTVLDDWDVMGLRGTGSKSVVLDDVFVPSDWTFAFSQLLAGNPDNPDPAYRQSLFTITGFCVSAPATGAARALYDLVLQDVAARVARQDPLFMGRKPLVQAELAKIDAMIDTSDMIFTRAMETTFAKVAAGERLSDAEKVRNRRDQTYSSTTARQAGELLLAIAGGKGITDASPVQAIFRDLSSITVHPGANWDGAAISFGAVQLGEAPTEIFI